ncbi:ABC transporter ATP-binding protein [Bradyrhizobium sp. LA7.1]|uniref:ABC transporter ATP-binding protein n=1 Tax=Bradyrhizobium sp. LA7.1 TaxID=3156324 RepID=UPI00339241C5
MSAISLRGVVKSYPNFTLGPVDLTVQRGELFGILGPPSAGKTSILKLILGLVKPDSGRILIGGADAEEMEVADRQISMVFQNLALFPHMSGRENIIFPLTEQGVSEDEIAMRLDAVSDTLHVAHILHKNPAQMSGGERQRIALGRALAPESRAILLDEPIAALDARLREEMRVELKRLQRTKSQTFVYVSHDEEEVMAIADRVAVVIDGRVVQVGAPDDVYNRPNSIAVAHEVGSPPMNLLSGRFSLDGRHFECGSMIVPIAGIRNVPVGEQGTLGVRPEDIHAASDRMPLRFGVKISSIEPLGAYTIVNAMLDDHLIKIRVSGQLGSPNDYGESVTFDTRRLHLFDCNGGRLEME